jgi:hypothetical protein
MRSGLQSTSNRYYGAWRYVTLPHEAHGYAARESIFHTVAETLNRLDKYVKAAGPRRATDSASRP